MARLLAIVADLFLEVRACTAVVSRSLAVCAWSIRFPVRSDLATPSRDLIHVILSYGRENNFLLSRERYQKYMGIEVVLDIVPRDRLGESDFENSGKS